MSGCMVAAIVIFGLVAVTAVADQSRRPEGEPPPIRIGGIDYSYQAGEDRPHRVGSVGIH